MQYLLYLVGALFVWIASSIFPDMKSAIHEIEMMVGFGFGFMIIGLGAVVHAIGKVRAA